MYTGPNIVTDGLVLYLDAANPKSYPGSGTVWKDLSGNGNHFNLINGPSFNNFYINFDGVDDYVKSINTLDLSSYNSISVEMCFQVNNLSSPTGFAFEHSSNWNNQIMGFGLLPNSSRNTNYTTNRHHTNQYQGAGHVDYDGIIGSNINNHVNIWSRINDPEGRLSYINGQKREFVRGDSSTSSYPNFRDDYFFIGSRNGSSLFYNFKVFFYKNIWEKNNPTRNPTKL